eukprot:2041824-Karenia_brevis.AAC.1
MLLVANVYGWTTGHHCEQSASRTDDLLSALIEEFAIQPDMPKLLVGDLNADTADLPALEAQLPAGEFY